MKNRNFLDTLSAFDLLAKKHKFVYSLFSKTINALSLNQTTSQPYEVVIDLETLTNLIFLEKNVLIGSRSYAAENTLPYIILNNEKIYLNLLIRTTKLKYSLVINSNFNKKIEFNLFKLIDKLNSPDPDLLVLLYFDSNEGILKIKKVVNLNPSYYSVIEIENKKFPYLEEWKSI